MTGDSSSIAGFFLVDQNKLLSFSDNGIFIHWELNTATPIAKSLITKDGKWAVFSPEGWFDGSKNFHGAHFVANNLYPISFSQLRDRFYQPFLLERLTGERNEPLPKALLNNLMIFVPPKVTTTIGDNSTQLKIDVENRNGGIGELEIKLNGTQVVGLKDKGHNLKSNISHGQITYDLSAEPKLKPGENNLVEVLVFNHDNTVASTTTVNYFLAPGIKADNRSNFYVLSIGTSDYKGKKLDLRFAAKDAQDFANALKISAKKQLFPDFSPDNIQILSTEKGYIPPTKANIQQAFARLKSTKPNDVVVVFLAGHGVKGTKEEEGYLYITQEGSSFADIQEEQKQNAVTISSKEFHHYLQQIPANKQVMILDTCASGAIANDLVTKRNLSADQIRAIDKLQRSSGLHVLMGSAGDAVSYEASQFGQGLLTYSLLEGMKFGEGLKDGNMVEVQKLFSYAQNQVALLAKEIGGVQQPRSASPSGDGFVIGQLDQVAQQKIALQSAKPRFVRSQFRAKKKPRDVLGVNEKVKKQLITLMDDGKLVFSDVAMAPNSCVLYGTYQQQSDGLRLDVELKVGDRKRFAANGVLMEELMGLVVEHCPVQ